MAEIASNSCCCVFLSSIRTLRV
ncbi:hypothetical protein [Priestia koreensis]